MRDDRPSNLKDMLIEAKNTSELMVDLAYAAIFYNSEDLSEEVFRLETRLNDLVYDMRSLAILAARSPADSEQMAGILQVVQDIPEAEEIPSRVRIHAESSLDGRSLGDVDLPVETGMRPIAIRREDEWDFEVEAEDVLRAGDVLFVQGPPEGVAEIRELAGARPMEAAPEPAQNGNRLSELERAVDILIEMKNLSEVAVGLAYSALLYNDAGLAREVVSIEDEMDEMRYRLERWVLLAASHVEDPSRLRGMLHLAIGAEAISDGAQEMVWVVEKGEEVHPVLSAAVEESDEVVIKLSVARGSPADGKTLGALQLETETGMFILAVNRGGRWTYRPRDTYTLRGGDTVRATGSPEGLEPLAEVFGQELE